MTRLSGEGRFAKSARAASSRDLPMPAARPYRAGASTRGLCRPSLLACRPYRAFALLVASVGLLAAACSGGGGTGGGATTSISPPTTTPLQLVGVTSYRQVPHQEWTDEDRALTPELANWQARVTSTFPPRQLRLRYSSGSCPSRPSALRAAVDDREIALSLTFDETGCPRYRPDILLFVVLEVDLGFDIAGRPVRVSTVGPQSRHSGAT